MPTGTTSTRGQERELGAEDDGSAPRGAPGRHRPRFPANQSAPRVGRERARSAAVIPFSVDPTEADSVQLAEGVSERILNALIRMPELKVFARASSFRYGADSPGLGRSEGSSKSITSSRGPSSEPGKGDASACSWWRLPPAMSAGRTPSSGHPRGGVGRRGGGTRHRGGAGPRATRSTTSSPSPDPLAIEKVMQARFYWNRRPGKGVVELAIQCYREAIEADPACAEAWSGLAELYATSARGSPGCFRTPRRRAKPVPAPPSAFPQSHPGRRACRTGVFRAALPLGQRRGRRELPPCHRPQPELCHRISLVLACLGCGEAVEESLAHSRAALQLDPMNLLIHVHLAWHHYMAREPGKTVEQAESVIRMGSHLPQGFRAAGLGTGGGGSACRSSRRSAGERWLSDGDPVMVAGLGRALASAGDVRAARETAARFAPDERGRDLFAYELAMIHLALGETEAAFERLDRALECGSGWIAYAHVHPRLDPIRADRRLQPILAAAPRALSPVHPPTG